MEGFAESQFLFFVPLFSLQFCAVSLPKATWPSHLAGEAEKWMSYEQSWLKHGDI